MKITKGKFVDISVLVLRWYLAFYMTTYGWSKLNGTQFIVHDPQILKNPIQSIDKFYIAWYLFGLSKSFNIINGLLELTGAALIVINRTALLGAIFLLPVLAQIMVIDLAFTTDVFGYALPVRLFGMILADFGILFYYRSALTAAINSVLSATLTKPDYPWWLYPILAIAGFLMDFVLVLVLYPLKALLNWIVSI